MSGRALFQTIRLKLSNTTQAGGTKQAPSVQGLHYHLHPAFS